MKSTPLACALAATTLFAHNAIAADIDVSVQNLTRGLYFTPILVAAHPENTSLFSSGQPASNGIQAMAEGGNTTDLQAVLTPLAASFEANPAGGLLAPAMTATTRLVGGADTNNRLLSIVSMILPSNDGFIGLNAIQIPSEPGTYTYPLRVYDAGTEGNDERRGSGAPGQPGMPVPPPLAPLLGINGTGVQTPAEGFIHIHRGNLGDTDANGGLSDIDSTLHRWQSPAAQVVITVN